MRASTGSPDTIMPFWVFGKLARRFEHHMKNIVSYDCQRQLQSCGAIVHFIILIVCYDREHFSTDVGRRSWIDIMLMVQALLMQSSRAQASCTPLASRSKMRLDRPFSFELRQHRAAWSKGMALHCLGCGRHLFKKIDHAYGGEHAVQAFKLTFVLHANLLH